MWFKKQDRGRNIRELMRALSKSSDFVHYHQNQGPRTYLIYYFKTLIDSTQMHRDILPYLDRDGIDSLEDMKGLFPINDVEILSDPAKIEEKLLAGYLFIQLHERDGKGIVVQAALTKSRAVSQTEIEFSVTGPKEAFIEDLDTNLNMIRRRIPNGKLRIDELTVGKATKTNVAILHLEGITNKDYVDRLHHRITNQNFDMFTDSSLLGEIVSDNSLSIFPQVLETERTDRVVALLEYGSVVFLSNGSPNAVVMPATLGWYFSSFDDYYLPWIIGSFFRIIRMFAVLFSVVATPLYVAVLTYHYEMIPSDLLATLVSSRTNIPFSPFMEALFLEITIELLREAGARMPTKIGQTLGIVGGIVIGTASVQASLTSNVLLIIVSLSALASFTTAIYRMTNTVRVLRYPLLIFAATWGLAGLVLCLLFYMVHLIRLTSLGVPYLAPVYPPRWHDLTHQTLFRPSYAREYLRPSFLRAQEPKRFDPKPDIREKEKKDIDE
ncbi:spore germination protein [Mechercharimyces sp. CAU 1602]|uniref:spore germination protein n=1 Tax=Mechercharimyces sp. CAU 1602 TaxID=2973933 RepID=UPI0021615CC7|nr:spore germination protein [Mechercharimyces sp. CAU 1602]MCS1352179.1 spore germination protein [Mechercharimyces sp. CAU 1602]